MLAQRANAYPVYIQSATLVTHIITCHVLIVKLELGMLGAALSTNATYLLNMILIDYILKTNSRFCETRQPFQAKSVFSDWKSYLAIGLPSAMMVCFEWWAFEVLAVLSGYISVAALAAEVVIINIVSFIFMMPLGISYAASSLTGNYLGQGKVAMARKFSQMTLLLNLILSILIIFLMMLFHKELSSLFTTDPDIVDIVE